MKYRKAFWHLCILAVCAIAVAAVEAWQISDLFDKNARLEELVVQPFTDARGLWRHVGTWQGFPKQGDGDSDFTVTLYGPGFVPLKFNATILRGHQVRFLVYERLTFNPLITVDPDRVKK